MSCDVDFTISWQAPILPAKSLAGIPLMTSVAEFEMVLGRYVVDKDKMLYQFDGSPVLSMAKGIDSNGDGGFGFAVHDRELTNWRLFFNTPEHAGANPRALYIIVRSWKVYAVKVWLFEKYKEGGRPVNSYRGKLACNIGLGDALIDLVFHVDLEFDSEEEWYVAKGSNCGLEISGYGVSLEDNPDQVVTALAVLVDE